MHILVMAIILTSTLFDFFVRNDWLPGSAKYLVEILGAVALLVVVAIGPRSRFANIRPAYWFIFAALLLNLICGVVANHVDSGPMFAGLRFYLRSIPLFFLPAVVAFSDHQLKSQLKLLLVLALIQLPIAGYQRMTTLARAGITGDTTYGTLMLSSVLSIFLIGVVAVLLGLYLRKRITMKIALFLFVLLLIPTTINETKGTIFLLPVALGTVFLVGAKPGTRMKNAFFATALLCIFGAIFIPIYDALIVVRPYPTKIGEFFTEPGRLEAYLSKRDAQIGTTEEVGRLDSMVVPLGVIAKDPVSLVFGLGSGNASKSSLGPNFTGHYNYLLEPFLMSTFSVVVSELGLLGFFLLIGLHLLIFNDCRIVAKTSNDFRAGLALGWAGVVLMMVICLPYKTLIPASALSYPFWYFSGVIAADRMRMLHAARRMSSTGRR